MIKVAFFDAKAYDKPSFEHYGSEHGMQFRFLETLKLRVQVFTGSRKLLSLQQSR